VASFLVKHIVCFFARNVERFQRIFVFRGSLVKLSHGAFNRRAGQPVEACSSEQTRSTRRAEKKCSRKSLVQRFAMAHDFCRDPFWKLGDLNAREKLLSRDRVYIYMRVASTGAAKSIKSSMVSLLLALARKFPFVEFSMKGIAVRLICLSAKGQPWNSRIRREVSSRFLLAA